MAEDGAAALETASNAEQIDLVLSDIVLPGGMNGIEIFEQLREQRPELKCLFMSGHPLLPSHLLPEGTETLAKPISLDDIATKTRQVLDT